VTGLSRPAVQLRVGDLLERRLVVERTDAPSTGGRPPVRLEFNSSGGVVLVAALGASRTRVAVCDLDGRELEGRDFAMDVEQGPDVVLPLLMDTWDELLGDRPRSLIRGVGMGVPATVEFAQGRTESARVMASWTGVVIPPIIYERFPVPVLVDNDVNVLAIGEHRGAYPDLDDLMFVKISTRIGAGVIAGGGILRGALGAAGEIGHIPVLDGGGVLCRCGNTDCVDSVASGTALLRDLRARGKDVKTIADVLAGAVNILNPSVVVLGGDMAEAFGPLVSSIREVVYRRSTALATRRLRIEPSRLGAVAGISGCAVMVLDHVLSPDAVDETMTVSALRRDRGLAASS
jgi:predicted NBD/HSP70 family sugar kinase